MGKMLFGTSEKLTCVADVGAKGPAGEPLCLAFKTSTVSFVAPLYLRKDGWVLGLRESPTQEHPTSFFDLPDGPRVAEMQLAGLLPAPFPPFQVATIDYVFGYMLWWVIALVALWAVVESRVKRRRAAREVAVAEAAADDGPPAK